MLPFSFCSELYAIIGFYQTKVSYFGNSVTKIFTTQEDYKPVIFVYIVVKSLFSFTSINSYEK